MKLRLVLRFVLVAAALDALLRAAPRPELAEIFRPFEAEQVTLSPDGRYLAYTQRDGKKFLLVVRDLQENSLKRILLGEARAADISGARELTPARLTFLRWGAEGRLVFNLNGENVWSIRADGTDARPLGNAVDYAPPPPLPGYQAIGFDEPTTLVIAPSALAMVQRDRQPVRIAAMTRGASHVFLEAEMRSRGVDQTIVLLKTEMRSREVVRWEGTPRVVLRADIATGKQQEWGETPQSEFILCDRAGYPRLIRRPDNIRNASLLTSRMWHARPQSTSWQLLDELIPADLATTFERTPARALGEHSLPLGFDYEANRLYFASNVGRDTVAVYALDLKNRRRTEIAIETSLADLVSPLVGTSARDALVFDEHRRRLVGLRYTGAERATLWFDQELVEVQQRLEEADASKRWEILEWNDQRTRFLALATSQSEPGLYHLYDRATEQIFEVVGRAPWLDEARRQPGISFQCRGPAGSPIFGYLTLPRQSRLKRPPLIALLHDGPWSRDYPGYDREAQALATMGFAVVQVNFRGSIGFGRKHLDAIRAAPDTVPIADALAAIDFVTGTGRVDPRLVALMGHGYGGFLALRALQLHPTRFRCAVTLDAPADLAAWINPPGAVGATFTGEMRRMFFSRDASALRALSPAAAPEKIQVPVLVLERGGAPQPGAKELQRALRRHGTEADYIALSDDETAGLPQAQAELFGRIEEFLNAHVYNYAVKLGEPLEKDFVPTDLAPALDALRADVPAIASPNVKLEPERPRLEEKK